MPDIDLEPHEFRSDRSKRNARIHLIAAIVAIAWLAYFWSVRSELTIETLFGVAAMFGFFAGGGLIVWLNQFRGV